MIVKSFVKSKEGSKEDVDIKLDVMCGGWNGKSFNCRVGWVRRLLAGYTQRGQKKKALNTLTPNQGGAEKWDALSGGRRETHQKYQKTQK